MGRPIHFELQSSDCAKAQKFYGDLFGWKFQQFGSHEYWLAMTGEGPGIDGGLMPSNGLKNWVCTIEVENLDAHLEKVAAAGGVIVVPKMPIPGVGWLAYGNDPDGNIFGMMQADPNAA